MAPGDGAGRSASTSVDCLIKLTDKLTDPTINFDIQLPNATPETQALVSQSINTQEAMATQFLWLLATKSFYSEYQRFRARASPRPPGSISSPTRSAA